MGATHAALLRGINVGRGNRLPMAQLREIAQGLGWTDVATYIQSGNLVFSATEERRALESALHDGIQEATGLDIAVFVLTREEVRALEDDCPWPDVEDPRHVHAFLFGRPLPEEAVAAVQEAVATAREQGSRDEAVVTGRVVYVHTPDGFGRSVLVALLGKAPVRRTSKTGDGTARNLATLRRVRALLDG